MKNFLLSFLVLPATIYCQQIKPGKFSIELGIGRSRYDTEGNRYEITGRDNFTSGNRLWTNADWRLNKICHAGFKIVYNRFEKNSSANTICQAFTLIPDYTINFISTRSIQTGFSFGFGLSYFDCRHVGKKYSTLAGTGLASDILLQSVFYLDKMVSFMAGIGLDFLYYPKLHYQNNSFSNTGSNFLFPGFDYNLGFRFGFPEIKSEQKPN